MNQVLVKSEIDKVTNTILDEVDSFSKKPKMNDVFGNGRNKIGRTQLNSLLMNVRNAVSVEELILFISYKEAKGQGWEQVCGGKTVAKHLIESLRTVENLADNIRTYVDKNSSKDEQITEDDMRVIKLMLAEKFLGYLYWKGTVMAN